MCVCVRVFALVLFYGISTIVGYLMPNPVLFQTIQFSIVTQFKCQKQFYFRFFSFVNKVKWFQVLLCITNNSIKHHSFIYIQLNDQTVLFQAIQFSISTQFSSIWLIDRTLLGATALGHSGHGSDGNEGVLWILQSSSISGALTIRLFSVISRTLIGGVLPLYWDAVSVFYSPSWLGQIYIIYIWFVSK